jgi:hypothetical protein
MRCPVCGSELVTNSTECSACRSRILPPPAGVPQGAVAYVADAEAPSRWPLVFSLLGIVAALAVIVVAIRPFLDGDPSELNATDEPVVTDLDLSSLVTSTVPIIVAVTEPPQTTAVDSGLPAAPVEPAAPPVPIGPAAPTLVEATCTARGSTDSRGNPVDFKPENTVDGDPAKAWRCDGNGVGTTITYSLAAPTRIVQVGAIPGYDRVDPFNGDDRFFENRRVQSANWLCLDAAGTALATSAQSFVDDRAMQVQNVTGFDACQAIRLEITDSTPSTRRDFVAISEVTLLVG